jgi:NADPH2:quinone reductase
MKAIRVYQAGDPEVMRLEQVPDPSPGPDQVLVDVQAIGVNPVETYIRSGRYTGISFPYTPGTDAAGVVAALGKNVSRFQVGQRVYAAGTLTGAYAELALCRESQLHPLPDAATFEQGAAMGIPYGTAYRALYQRAMAVPGELVLVHGASGGVGSAAVQLGRARGLQIIGTAGSDRGRDLVRQLGAQHVVDHHAPDYIDQIMRISGGRGVDVVLEMLANVNLAKDLTLLARNGRVIVIGNRGTIEVNPRELMSRDATVCGILLFNASEAELTSIHAALVSGLENGTVQPVIGQSIPLGDAARAHRAVLSPGAYGKIVLVP